MAVLLLLLPNHLVTDFHFHAFLHVFEGISLYILIVFAIVRASFFFLNHKFDIVFVVNYSDARDSDGIKQWANRRRKRDREGEKQEGDREGEKER